MPTGTGRPIIKSLLFARLWFLLLHLKFGCHHVSYASEMKNNICMSTKFSKCSHANASSDQGQENQGSLQNLPLGVEKQVARAQASRLVVCPGFLFVRVSVCEEPRTRPHGRCWAGRHQMKKKQCVHWAFPSFCAPLTLTHLSRLGLTIPPPLKPSHLFCDLLASQGHERIPKGAFHSSL